MLGVLLLRNGVGCIVVIALIPGPALSVGCCQIICANHHNSHLGHVVAGQLAVLDAPPQVGARVACKHSVTAGACQRTSL